MNAFRLLALLVAAASCLPRATASSPPSLLTNVPMQGPMVHVNFLHTTVAGAPRLEVHLDASTPVLTPLAVSHPGLAFDPAHPWHAELDPARRGHAFNRQYGFLMDGASEPLPEGHTLRIRQVGADPGLLARRYRQAPPAWEPMFGQDGSAPEFEWNQLMFHPAYAIPAAPGDPVQAHYEAYVADAGGSPVGSPATFTLTWQVTPSLFLNSLRLAEEKLEVEATLPAAWQGSQLVLERHPGAPHEAWTPVATLVNAAGGTHVLRDPAPSSVAGLYRVRAVMP